MTDKTSAEWIRVRHPVNSPQDRFACLAFVMDGALAFIPLTHSNMFLDDAAATSSLDFALRFFTGEVEPSKWHLRELKSVVGGDGRTYNEARIWGEEGNMVASMTQQCILRPHKGGSQASL